VLSGQLNTELRATDAGYVATHVIKPKGIAKLRGGRMNVRSEFTTVADGVRPVRFHEVDTIRNDPETRIEFDWTTNQASGTVGTEDVLLQLDGVSHDNVSIQYELMHDLLNGGPAETYVLFDVDKMRIANDPASEGRLVSRYNTLVCRGAGFPARYHRAASQRQVEFQGDIDALHPRLGCFPLAEQNREL
jgi:hypothetical protein